MCPLPSPVRTALQDRSLMSRTVEEVLDKKEWENMGKRGISVEMTR
jgi:hypothetical protein